MGTINLITQPTGGAPLSTNDYNYQNVDIGVLLNVLLNKSLLLTEWDTLTVPAITRYVYINHGGAIFQVQDSDYAITDPGVADGRVYIKVERSGDVLEAEFTDDTTGYSWNYIYNGFYHADGSQLLPYVLWLDSGNWTKFNLDKLINKFDISSYIIIDLIAEIGAWDMTSLAVHNASLEYGNYVIGINSVNIVNDSGTQMYPLNFSEAPGFTENDGSWRIYVIGALRMYVRTGGVFDDAEFNGAGNRGYINYTVRI